MKRMKKLCGAIMLVTISTIAFSQQINPKIQEVYSEKNQDYIKNDPERLAFYNDLLENRVKIIESPLSDNDKYTKLSTVGLLNKYNPSLTRDIDFNAETFNPLKYNFSFTSKIPVLYRVDNTNYLIVIEPQKIN